MGVWHATPAVSSEDANVDPRTYFTYRDENRVFEDIGCWASGQVSVTGLAEPEQPPAMWVTAGLLPLLRAQPVIVVLGTDLSHRMKAACTCIRAAEKG